MHPTLLVLVADAYRADVERRNRASRVNRFPGLPRISDRTRGRS